jgi:glycosyltransferase involved in cell wall biosynthesis
VPYHIQIYSIGTMSSPQKPITILQVLPTLRSGGVERGTIEVASAITKQGWKSLVASAGGAMVPQVNYVGGTHHTLPLDSKNPFVIWQNISKLEKLIKEYKVDIIHARSRAPAWSAYFAAKRAGIPFMTTFHGVYGTKSTLKKRYNSVMVKGERVIAISAFISDHIKAHYTFDESRIRIIHRGVDLNIFDPTKIAPQRMAALMQEWRAPEGKPIIFVPGRFTRWKGQDVVIKALAKLESRNFTCVMVGDDIGHPAYRKELEQLVIDCGLEGLVRLAPSTSSMPEAYMLAHVVICPSIEPEAFGRVPVEAQAMGKPVITTAHGGAMETVIDGQTGVLVKPNDPTSLAEAIKDALLLSPLDTASIGEAAIAHVRKHFTTARMCEGTIKVYKELLETDKT